jgi:hypothetical protein
MLSVNARTGLYLSRGDHDISKWTTFWLQDKMRIYSDLNFKNMPDNYWGVGYDKGLNTPYPF